jgi:putative surface-exposed virulence protein
VVNQDGELDVSGGGHGIDITGDSATVDNKGGMTVTDPDSIGIQIDGDKAVVNNDGDSAISNGGTGTQINGDEATVNNNGNTTVDGQGSTGTEIAGNNAVVNQDGELDVSGGGHGIDITGDSATVDNKGGMTVTDPDSIGIQIDGDKAVVNNDGDNAISNGGAGTQVNGNEATVNNNGNTTVDGKDSTGTEINGDKAIVNNDGDSTILDGGTGTRITGDDATANNSGNTTVDGQGSTGTEIAGNNAVVNQDGELDLLSALTGSGETDMRTASSGGFVTTKALANYGNETLNSNVTAKAWLYNQDKANLTINGELSVGQGLENSGLLDSDTISAAANVYNRASGSIITDLLMLTSGNSFFNEGNFSGSIVGNSYRQNVVNTGSMTVTADGTSLIGGSFVLYNEAGAILSNSNSAVSGGENAIVNITRTSDSLAQVNRGTITATNGYSAIKTASTGSNSNGKWIWNTDTGVISGVSPNALLIDLGRGYNFANAGTINVQGDGAVAISGGTTSYTVQLVNSGTINVGTAQGKADGTNGTGLIGIKGNGRETTINNAQSGVINVYADNSWAFGGQTKTIINNGEINLLCDMGCDIYAPGTTGTLNDHNSTTDIIVPAATSTPTQGSVPTVPADSSAQQKLTNYTIGTNSDGTSGMLKANNLVISDNVKVNTGFSAGTADTTVVINDVFKGENISGAENISSSTVMWNAQGSTDASGNVDVTMTKNAYTDVVTDSSVNNVAQVLDTGYTNNDLYTSLNVGTTAELNSALKQISGSQATTVFNEARVLSNRFSMLSDAAPEVANGLAFNVVAKGDPRAELGNNTQYDMMALRKSMTLTEYQNLSLEYGIARLDGNGSDTAGDNGVTGGYSQFFGLKHQMAFDNGMSWNNALRYDVHNLDSSRSIAYGDVNKTADANVKQQYLEFRSEGAKTFELREGLNVTPYAGVKLRHTLEGGYQERNAGDFNLSMNSGSETAVDSIVGLKLDYAGKEGWSANATLEGGPNLSYVKSQRTASISGAGSQRFNIDDGQNGGGFNSLATMGVKYSSQESALQVDAFHWKEDGISDKGVMLNFKKTF